MVVVSLIEHLGTLVQISRQDILPFAHKTESLPWPSAFLVSPPVVSSSEMQVLAGQVLAPTSKVQEGRGICPQVRGSAEGGYFKGTSVAVQLLESTGMSQTILTQLPARKQEKHTGFQTTEGMIVQLS